MKAKVALPESELEETFSRSSGPGGQNVNKVSSKVTLRHLPTQLSVTVQDTRSREQNRVLARERLQELLIERTESRARQRREALELARRRRSPRPGRLKRRILDWKRKHSERKRERARPGGE